MPLPGYQEVPEGVSVTASYGSVGAQAASAVDLESYPPLSSTARSRSRALILGFATLLFTGVAVIGYASQQHVRQNKVAPAPESMPLRSSPPSLDLVADTASGSDADTTSAAAPTTASPNVTQHVFAGCRDCTINECKTLTCDMHAAPFACLSGFARGGCSKVAKAWDNSGCSACCDMTACQALVQPCGKCSTADCMRVGPICGMKRPYACVEGPSNGGCSDDPDNWPPLVFDGVCTRCCDLTTCPDMPGCGPCTNLECIQVGKGCFNSTQPFACTNGAAMGGCAATEDFWKKAEFSGICGKCCDTAACAPKPSVPKPSAPTVEPSA